MNERSILYTWFTAVSLLCLVGVGASNCVQGLRFDRTIGEHLELAANAQTVDLARQELSTAIQNIEAQHLTEGYTSIFYATPSDDLGFWHQNLRAALAELNSVSRDATLLERSNVLMRLRSTLLVHTKEGEHVTCPEGVSLFPNNKIYGYAYLLFSLLVLTGGVLWVRERGYERTSQRDQSKDSPRWVYHNAPAVHGSGRRHCAR